jgi:erythronate-4-phosphate dehydrogenase
MALAEYYFCKSMRIVVDKNNPHVADAFQQFGEVRALSTREINRDSVRDADILIVRSETIVTKELLYGSSVRFVGTATIGTDHIEIDYLRANGIGFASAPGSNANSVAEYIVAALLTLAQRKGFNLEGKTIGVVGVGNVGSKVVRNANALGMGVLQNDPPLSRTTGNSCYLPLDDLMDADIITLHVPLTKTGEDPTYHLFDSSRIDRMKKGAVLINTARGGIVDSAALANALERRHLGSVVLDVWEGEPEINIELLKIADIGTPHIAGYSFDGKLAAVKMTCDAACSFFGRPQSWTPGQAAPGTEVKRIVVSSTTTTSEDVLRGVIRQCYDIECDDRSLRGITAVSDTERRSYFTRLRAEYRVRREFHNTTVELPAALASMREALTSIGFRVAITNP